MRYLPPSANPSTSWGDGCRGVPRATSVKRRRTSSIARAPPGETGGEYTFVILERGGEVLLGGCGLNQLDWQNRRANLGYWIRRSSWGRGVAAGAARLVAEFGFRELQLDRIEIIAATENIASQRVAEKIGSAREGIARGAAASARYLTTP